MAFHDVAVLAYVERYGTKYEVGPNGAREAVDGGEAVHLVSYRHHTTSGSIAPHGAGYAVTITNGPHGGGVCQGFQSAWLMARACLNDGPRNGLGH